MKLSWRISTAWRIGRSASVFVHARPFSRASCRFASFAASVVVARQQLEERREALLVEREAGRELPEDRPELLLQRSTPDAKKFASGISTSFSFFMCVMNRPPLTEKTKSSGVASCHAW